jgi:transcriptional regulator GlxA family with amidase domain
VLLMEANIEEPLTTDEIAQHVCVSRRQLERIFKQYLNRVPSQYYLELRLNKARQMLMQTSKSIIQIGLSCGFSSGPHFSSAYRNFFGATPREDRNQRRSSSPFELSSAPWKGLRGGLGLEVHALSLRCRDRRPRGRRSIWCRYA